MIMRKVMDEKRKRKRKKKREREMEERERKTGGRKTMRENK